MFAPMNDLKKGKLGETLIILIYLFICGSNLRLNSISGISEHLTFTLLHFFSLFFSFKDIKTNTQRNLVSFQSLDVLYLSYSILWILKYRIMFCIHVFVVQWLSERNICSTAADTDLNKLRVKLFMQCLFANLHEIWSAFKNYILQYLLRALCSIARQCFGFFNAILPNTKFLFFYFFFLV